MRKITKLFNIDIKSVNETLRQITFCFSDDGEDREGEVVDQASWDVKNYMNNPLILWGHNPEQPENVLGQGVSLDLNNGGKSYITAQFDDVVTNPRADMVFRQLVKRSLRCVSAGFINHTFEVDNDTPLLKDNELLEVSIVPIPANPRAIALAYKAREINTKDLNWMKKSMLDELEFIEKQLATTKHKDATMDEATKQQISALLSAVESLTKAQADTNEKLEAVTTKLTESQAAVDETKKAADEAVKAEAKAKEEADAKAAADAKAEAEKKAADEASKTNDVKDAGAGTDKTATDSAKGGSDDQSGAEGDELDEDAEVTPEIKAQLDNALAEAATS